MSFLEILRFIDDSLIYRIALIFYGFYPMAMALVWVVLAAIYFHRRERSPEELAPADFHPRPTRERSRSSPRFGEAIASRFFLTGDRMVDFKK